MKVANRDKHVRELRSREISRVQREYLIPAFRLADDVSPLARGLVSDQGPRNIIRLCPRGASDQPNERRSPFELEM